MKLIKNKIEKLEQKYDLQGIYEQIELAGRTAYKSLDKIEYDKNGRSITAKAFVDKMVKLHHGSPLEHGTVYLKLPHDHDTNLTYTLNSYSYTWYDYSNPNSDCYVTTNYRVLVEHDMLDDLFYLCKPTEHHVKRTTMRLTLARVQADSFTRHRVFSFLMESTRYCCYANDKFNNEIQVVLPTNWESFTEAQKDLFTRMCNYSESSYIDLVNSGMKAEDARDILPLQLKTELIMTGTDKQWEQFFKLRISDHAHPDAKYIATEIKNAL